ncbi:nuclear pore complex protein Nup205-like [Argonauta hians]
MACAEMAVNSGAKLWTPFKELYDVVDSVLLKKQVESIHDLEVMLRRHKPDFISLLKAPEKNSVQRERVKKATKEGLPVYSEQRTQILTQDIIEESLLLSDLYNLNEFAAVEFILSGQNQQPNYPGLSRGLVAVLLYYDGRRALCSSLRVLLQAREGRMWTMGNEQDITDVVMKYTDVLIENGLVNKILNLIQSMDLDAEIEKLEKDRALGPPKHRKQVIDLFKEIRLCLAECLFHLAAQQPLKEHDTLRLVAFLKDHCTWLPDGSLDSVSLFLLMTLLYCFDSSLLEHDDTEEMLHNCPMLSDDQYIRNIHRVVVSDEQWNHPGVKAVIKFAWAMSLRQLYISQHSCAPGVNEYCEEDETIVATAIKEKVFLFLRTQVIASPNFFQEEFFVTRIHGLLTDFIVHMPLKVTELRNLDEEAARIIMVHIQQGLDPPSNLSRDFEELLKLLASLYGKDKLGLESALEYWYPTESLQSETHFGQATLRHRPTQRQVALHKFVRLAGDLLPSSLYVPYIKMLTGLANSPQCAWHCYNLLKMNSMNSGSSTQMVSWDHVFLSLNQYYVSLRREVPSQTFGSYHTHGGITPQEQEALIVVLQLTQQIANQNKESRIAIYENQQWQVVTVLFGLASCSIPVGLKAEVLLTLAALAKSPEIAGTIWQGLESSQIVATFSSNNQHQQFGSIQIELEEVESRNEEYVLTRAFLSLISTLIDHSIPAGLGAGHRSPGFQPYLDFIIDGIFLKCFSRAYKNPTEKWDVAYRVVEILFKILSEHKIQPEHFSGDSQLAQGEKKLMLNKLPGHILLILMLNDSGLLQMILKILNDSLVQFATYVDFPGRESLEKACLYCLRMIEVTLEKEDAFLAAIRESGSSIVVVCLDRLMRGVNPATGKPDHFVNISKFVIYNNQLFEHALSAIKILFLVCRSTSVQADLVAMFTQNEIIQRDLLQGFVECMENEEDEDVAPTDGQKFLNVLEIRNTMRKHLMQLLINSLDYPAPNVALFLLGFELRKPVEKTNLQDPGVLGCPRTCLHSLITILNRGVGTRTGPRCLTFTPQLAELAYHLLYVLCANKETSPPTMRYLRTVHDFFYRQLKHLPFIGESYRNSLMNQQSWLLKAMALELRLTSLNRHRSHTERLMKLLLEDVDVDQISVSHAYGSEENEFSIYGGKDASISQYPTIPSSRLMTGTQTRRKILRILDSLDFTQDCPQRRPLQFFEENLIEDVIKSCCKRPKNGPAICDVKALRRVLIAELSNLQGTNLAGQRTLILREVEIILEQVVSSNAIYQSLYSKYAAFEAWRQVTEVLVTACTPELLDKESQHTLLFELLQDLLIKVADNDALQELTAPVAGVILVVMANLRRCFSASDSLISREELPHNQPVASSKIGTRTLFATSLHIVLKGLLDYIQKSCGSQQKVRTYLYGALLYYLQIAQKPALPSWVSSETEVLGVSRVLITSGEEEFDNLSKENLSIILSYGDSLLDIICKDICDGHNVGRLLALSLLDCILFLDKSNQCLNFMISKGYLQHLIDGVVTDDIHLQNLLNPSVESLKHLYSFEGRMTFCSRVASSPAGAYSLLRHGFMQRLAECKVFSMRPEHERGQTEGSSCMDEEMGLSPLARYRRLLFPVLKVCLAIISSVGVENSNAAKEILIFIVSHGDVFHGILRDRHNLQDLGALQELELATAVISKVAVHVEANNSNIESNVGVMNSMEFYSQVSRIQREMLGLLQRFVLSEKVLKVLQNIDSNLTADGNDVRAEISLTYKKVITNAVAYCRLLITKSGSNAEFCKIIFGPNLEERNIGQDDTSFSRTYAAGHPPNLTVVVQHLKQCSSQFMSVFDSYQQLKRKLASVTDLTPDDLKEYSGVADLEKVSTQQQQQLAKKRLIQIIGYCYQELQNFSYIIENCLFILWRHLEYYLLHCVPLDQQPNLYQAQHREQSRRFNDMTLSVSTKDIDGDLVSNSFIASVTCEELDALKCNAPAIIGDALMKKILEINQCFGKARSHYSFVGAVVRRIRRLLRLHTSDN